jgi:hypothetical protein
LAGGAGFGFAGGDDTKPVVISSAAYAALKRRSSAKPQRLKPSDFVGVFVARLEVVPFPFVSLSDKGQGQRTGVSAPQVAHFSRRVRARSGASSVMALPTQAKIGLEWATADLDNRRFPSN